MPTLGCQAWLLPMNWATGLSGRGRDCASLARGGCWSRRAPPWGSVPSLGLAGPRKFRQPESTELNAERSGLTPAPPRPNSSYMTLAHCLSFSLPLCIYLYSGEDLLPCFGKHIEMYAKPQFSHPKNGTNRPWAYVKMCTVPTWNRSYLDPHLLLYGINVTRMWVLNVSSGKWKWHKSRSAWVSTQDVFAFINSWRMPSRGEGEESKEEGRGVQLSMPYLILTWGRVDQGQCQAL
ncbi:hypothetical protein HispidOSU_003905 [Sigmodon hispidus]